LDLKVTRIAVLGGADARRDQSRSQEVVLEVRKYVRVKWSHIYPERSRLLRECPQPARDPGGLDRIGRLTR
jgi:hypothetical protein